MQRDRLLSTLTLLLGLGGVLAPARGFAQGAETVTVPALTPVTVRIEKTISSNKNKPGDRFPITVVEDVRVGDAVVIPAGSIGEGEVVHASKSGGGGKAGELILAARYVSVGGREVRLRSFTLGVQGKDKTNVAVATGSAVGLFGMLVKGGVATAPAGALGMAKTAFEFELPVQSTGGGEDDPTTH